jgi:putative alpha-1,2-mannosidase
MQDNLETQYWAREVMDRLYKPDGYCGDEDNGQTLLGMFFCDGFYPVLPATGLCFGSTIV